MRHETPSRDWGCEVSLGSCWIFEKFVNLVVLSLLYVEVSDLDHPRGVKKSKKIPPKSGSNDILSALSSPGWFLVLYFGHPIISAWGYDQDSTHLLW